MKRVIAALLVFGMVITVRAVAERELFAPSVLAPVTTSAGGNMTFSNVAPFWTGANISSTTNFGIGPTTASVLTFHNNGAERMRINSTGEVGIGRTPSSGYMLDIDHATDTRIALYNAGTRIGILQAASSLFSIAGVSTNPIALLTNGVERARVKSSGQLRFVPLAAAPTSNVEDGDVYYNSTTNKLQVRAAGVWVDLH